MNARPDRKATPWPGLLEKLVSEVRAEFLSLIHISEPTRPY